MDVDSVLQIYVLFSQPNSAQQGLRVEKTESTKENNDSINIRCV